MRLGVLKELRPRLVATFSEKPGSCEGEVVLYAIMNTTLSFLVHCTVLYSTINNYAHLDLLFLTLLLFLSYIIVYILVCTARLISRPPRPLLFIS